MSQRLQAIIIDASDNVATAIVDLNAGQTVRTQWGNEILVEDVPFGHKFALTCIPKGGFVVKYGTPIGCASSVIEKGCLVHVHNVEDLGRPPQRG